MGKIYNVLSCELAEQAYTSVPGIRDITVWMVSTIGSPVNEPLVVSAQIGVHKGYSLKRISGKVRELITSQLAGMEKFCEALTAADITFISVAKSLSRSS